MSDPSLSVHESEAALRANAPRTPIKIGLLTGGGDRHYAYGLAMALVSKDVSVDFVGGDEVDSPEMHRTPNLTFLGLRQNGQRDASFFGKAWRVLLYYARLFWYAATARPKVFHILWNNKFEFFDRTLLLLYYRILRKKIVLTAHNVNAGTRDSSDSMLNRLSLRIQYRLAHHIFVHTEKMKSELHEEFSIRKDVISVIPYGINNAVPTTELTADEAKRRLGIRASEKTILFFGNIAPYKGLEYLVTAFEQIVARDGDYRLIVAGRAKKDCEKYAVEICQSLTRGLSRERAIVNINFIPDNEMELYFKAADVSVLPYTHIFQSGVLFLGYSFGLPVIAADVGSLREDIIEGETGFLFRPRDPEDLARAIERYFATDLYRHLAHRRDEIRNHAKKGHSWDSIGETTRQTYAHLLGI
ncbi:MAG TPA: glycosyltransferase family 4 protein [Candidatus Dormibacteraeota bacterium]|nr:glycosyltransferase family 4 protein [Candidatus Dormibacteraeota bacterium]